MWPGNEAKGFCACALALYLGHVGEIACQTVQAASAKSTYVKSYKSLFTKAACVTSGWVSLNKWILHKQPWTCCTRVQSSVISGTTKEGGLAPMVCTAIKTWPSSLSIQPQFRIIVSSINLKVFTIVHFLDKQVVVLSWPC